MSEPLTEPLELSGSLSGLLRAAVNKHDFDVSVVLYEVTPDGRLFHLTYFIGRASYAEDMTARRLLTPRGSHRHPLRAHQDDQPAARGGSAIDLPVRRK